MSKAALFASFLLLTPRSAQPPLTVANRPVFYGFSSGRVHPVKEALKTKDKFNSLEVPYLRNSNVHPIYVTEIKKNDCEFLTARLQKVACLNWFDCTV